MADPVDALILDLLEWIGSNGRPYREVIEAWRTSCPRLPVWEEANERGFIEHRHSPESEATVCLSASGMKHLAEHRQRDATGVRATDD
jgi:D-3-phosphoglycerate dehydrogenase